MRDVKVEFGGKELTISLDEAKRWADQGIAEWLPRRNRMRFTARRDPKLVARGFSTVVGETVANSNQQWARVLASDQLDRPIYRKP